MYNVVTKSVLTIFLLTGLVSCESTEEKLAKSLYSQAEQAIEAQSYAMAVELLDSIDAACPTQVEVRRAAMHLKPKAIEGKTLRDIEANDSIIASLQVQFNQMEPLFKKISDPKLVEPYFVAKNGDKQLFDKTGIQARISLEGEFYVISSLQGSNKHTSVSLLSKGESATTSTVNYDGDRNYRSSNSEMITFIDSECDTLGRFAVNHFGETLSLRFNGTRNKSIKLTKPEVESLAITYRYSVVIRELKQSIRRKERLEQLLSLARDQMARTFDESSANE